MYLGDNKDAKHTPIMQDLPGDLDSCVGNDEVLDIGYVFGCVAAEVSERIWHMSLDNSYIDPMDPEEVY